MHQVPGTPIDAERYWRNVLASDPRSLEANVQLCLLLRNRRDPASAAVFGKNIIDLAPKQMEGYMHLGLCRLMQAKFDEALQSFDVAATLHPSFGLIHYNRGLALRSLGRISEALQAVKRALDLEPANPQFTLGMGELLLASRNFEEAKRSALRVLEIDRNSSAAHSLLAKALSALEEHEEAELHMRAAVTKNPGSPQAHAVLGFRLLQKGEFAEADACFTRSAQIQPIQGLAYYGATQARKVTEKNDPIIQRMETAARSDGMTSEERSFLHFGLAKAYNDLGIYDRAMNHFDEAHRFGSTSPFDRSAHASEIDATIAIYTQELLQAPPPSMSNSDLPILIVGMMRSGTTLVEQILSSHPEVGAAGEQAFWGVRASAVDDRRSVRFLASQAKVIAREYCATLAKISPGTPHVTDKLPSNYLRLGMIHLSLPNARIIHTRRNPLDTCVSIYTTPNPAGPTYAHSREDIVFVYRQYLRLMAHWRDVLPAERFMEIDYEDLVTDPRSNVEKLLAFCGLEWNEACLHPEDNSKAVHTPSVWQVRKPFYRGSIGRWRNYEGQLGALKELLDA